VYSELLNPIFLYIAISALHPWNKEVFIFVRYISFATHAAFLHMVVTVAKLKYILVE
jgi:hypothetical protein